MDYNIAIIGAGGFAKEVYGLCQDLRYSVLGFYVEENYSDSNKILFDKTITVGIMDSKIYPHVIAIGHPHARRRIAEKYKHKPKTLIHPSVIYYDMYFGEGCIICPNVVVTYASIGRYVHVNLSSTIGHDAVIGDYVTISPGVHISGNVTIGDCVSIGTGAVILPGINIGDNAIIGAGAVVNRDVEDGITVAGVPARRIK